MSRMQARLLLGLVIAGVWLVFLPAIAMADGCEVRVAGYAGGQLKSIADGDCRPTEIAVTGATIVAGGVTVGTVAVAGGLAGRPGVRPPADGGRPPAPVTTGTITAGPPGATTLGGLVTAPSAGPSVWQTPDPGGAGPGQAGYGGPGQAGGSPPGSGGPGQAGGSQPGSGAGDPATASPPTDIISGPDAIKTLLQSGRVKQATGPDGKPLWEKDPNGNLIPVVKPVGDPSSWDPTGGTPTTRQVGTASPAGPDGKPLTGPDGKPLPPDWVQNQTITGIQGYGGITRPDGTLDPNNTVIVVGVNKPDPMVPVAPPAPQTSTTTSPQTQPAPTGPQTAGAGPSQTQPTGDQSGQPGDKPDQTSKPPQKPPVVQVPVDQGASPPQTAAAQTPSQTPPKAPAAKPPDVKDIPTDSNGNRVPKNPDQVAVSVMQPGTTLIDTQTGGFVSPNGKITTFPGGVPDFVKGALGKDSTFDTGGGQVGVTVNIKPTGALTGDLDLGPALKGFTDNLPSITAKVGFTAQGGKLTVTAPPNDTGSQGLAALGNKFLDGAGGPNQQWANARGPGFPNGLSVQSVSSVTDPATGRTYVKLNIVPRP